MGRASGGLPASALARINRASAIGPLALTSSPQVLATITLDAPGPGFDRIASLIESLARGLGDLLLDRQLATAAE